MTSTSTSPARGPSTSMVSMERGLPASHAIAALVCISRLVVEFRAAFHVRGISFFPLVPAFSRANPIHIAGKSFGRRTGSGRRRPTVSGFAAHEASPGFGRSPLDHGDERRGPIGLRQKVETLLRRAAPRLAVSCRKQDWEVRPPGPDRARQVEAVAFAGHDEIREHEVEAI